MKSKITFLSLIAVLIAGVLALYLPTYVKGATQVNPTRPTPSSILTLSQSPTSSPTKTPKPLRLFCLDRSTKALRTSDVESGCKVGESSLGATAIKKPAKRPSDLNPFLKVRFLAAQAEAAKSILPPDVSRHPWGLALDINYPNDRLSTKWLEINGYKYGLCRVYKNEWWHFEGATAPGNRCPALHPDATWDLESFHRE